MKNLKRIMALILTLVLASTILIGCGGTTSEPDPNAGTYNIESFMGMSIEDAEALIGESLADYIILTLDNGGKGKMTVEGEDYSVKWEVDGTTIKIDDGADVLEGTIENGKITTDFEGTEVVFSKTE